MESQITIEKAKYSRIKEVDFTNIPFGRIFSDHMFMADYYDGAWRDFRIVPFGKFPFHPATSALHYGQSIFEGLKAYKSIHGEVQLFRPQKNIERLNKSARRMAMPEFPEDIFFRALNELMRLDHAWIPSNDEGSLYIRPLMFATDEYVGIKPSDNYRLIIFTCPVGPYYDKPVKVWMDDRFVRAFPGGVGTAKAAGNYGATLYAVKLARARGYDQLLWLDGIEHRYLQEIGTMNVFFQIDECLVTPTLEEGTILEGITRDSVITLLREEGVEVQERRVTVDEIFEAYDKGLLKDAFGTGTAATISQIAEIGYKDKKIILNQLAADRYSSMLKEKLEDIKRSKIPDRYNWMYRIETSVAASKSK
ncbi:MAG: putative branched-chain-amino-acid aminotransferase [Chitinophagales bacterium]|nr:MAG: putative branched-chain-amino-acid aminotransferase [Chitinophagales bacterium]